MAFNPRQPLADHLKLARWFYRVMVNQRHVPLRAQLYEVALQAAFTRGRGCFRARRLERVAR